MTRDARFAGAVLLAALTLAGTAAAQGRSPSDMPRVSAADVVLYLDEAPCANATDVAEIAVQQESMPLAAVLRALRLEAAHRGANGVRDIQVAPGGEGRFRVSGMAIRCPAAAPFSPSSPPDAAPQPRPRGMPAPRGAAEPDPVDPRIADFLGRSFLAVVRGADRVESFHLGGRGAGGHSIQSFAVLGQGRDLTPAQIARLRALILDPASYLFDTSKRCPFIADVGFVFHRGSETASVALATRCKLWSFAPAADPGRPAIEDFDPAAAALTPLIAQALGQK